MGKHIIDIFNANLTFLNYSAFFLQRGRKALIVLLSKNSYILGRK
jgi:hypothetical protein